MKSTKKAFIGALLALVICFTMLVGSTLAWFTDSASVGIQTITTGTLDLTIEDGADDTANSLEGQILTWQKKNANVGDPVWWEPGATYETNEFYIKNEGNLNLKFKIALDDFQGDVELLDVITFDITSDLSEFNFVQQSTPSTGSGHVTLVLSGEFDLLEGYHKPSMIPQIIPSIDIEEYPLMAGQVLGPLKVTAHMAESAGNEYMNKALTGIGFTIIAAQEVGEFDSESEWYDKDAEYPLVIKDSKQASEELTLNNNGISLDVPANAPAGEYVMSVSNQSLTVVDEQTTIAFDIELARDGVNVEKIDGVNYTVSLPVGGTLNIDKVLHKGEEVTNYTYDALTGVLTFTTDSFSPFEIVLSKPESGKHEVTEDVAHVVPSDVIWDSTLEIAEGVEFVLDLNNKEIIASAGIINNGTLTINGDGKIVAEGYVIENNGTLVINGGTFEGKGIIRSKAGSVTINDGEFYASSRWQDGVYQHTLKVENTVAVINGGNFDATVNGQTNAVINVSTGATLTINDGSFKNVADKLANFDPYLFTYENDGKLIINDGTFFGGWRFNGNATTEINGGNFVVSHDGQSFHANSTHKLVISGGTFTPNTQYPNSSLAGKVEANLAKYYVANEVEGNVVVEVQPGTGKVSYRAYVMNSWRQAIQIDMENIFAMESLVVELWHNDTLLSTTTYTGSYPCDRPSYTTCAVRMPSSSSFASWNTEYSEGVTLTNLNVPNAIKVYADGELVDTFTHKSGSVLDDKLNDYLALEDVTIYGIITPENYATVELESNKTYVLSGDFAGARVSLVMAEGVENVVLDGLTATNIEQLIVTQNGRMIDNAVAHIGDRSGKVTIQNFTVLSGIDVFACKTEVEICGNKAEALSVYAGNCAINIHHNEFDSKGETHSIYSNSNNTWGSVNEYAVTLRIYDYDLKFDNNVATGAVGHVVGINGYQSTFNVEAENNIQSFTNNNLTVNSTVKTNRAALKIWDDCVYAPKDSPSEVNEKAQAVINSVLAEENKNVITLVGESHYNFSIYNVNTNN